MKNTEPIWITEAEAIELAGFKKLSPETFRRYVREGKLDIGFSKLTRKSEPRYNKNDITRLRNECSTQAA